MTATQEASPLASFDPYWRSDDVMCVARGIWYDKAFERMPILADALMDKGCDDERIIGYCKGSNQREMFSLLVVILAQDTILVDYDQVLQDAIAEGYYDWSNSDITEEHFPRGEDEKGIKEQTFTLYHFGKDAKTDWVIGQMEKDHKRPAGLRELLVYGKANPEIQRYFPIFELKDVWVLRSGNRRFAYLSEWDSERELSLNWDVNAWRGHCRFLAVSE